MAEPFLYKSLTNIEELTNIFTTIKNKKAAIIMIP